MCLILHHDPWTLAGQSPSVDVHQRLAEMEFSQTGRPVSHQARKVDHLGSLMASLLVVQPDPVQAELLRKALAGRIPADFKVVASLTDALAAIDQHVPDVILLPTLMATAVEEYVIAYLSALRGTAHVQILGLPRLAGLEDAVPLPARSLFPWRWRRRAPRALIIPGCDPGVFTQDVVAYLASARALKAEIKRSRWGVEWSDAPDRERRREMRFANADVPWIGIVNFEGERAALINVSSRGALLQTDSRPGPHLLKRLDPQVRQRSRLTLELEWDREVHAEGRVIRCVPLETRARNRYEIAFAFDQAAGLHLPGADGLVPALTSGDGDEQVGLPARHLLTAGARR